MILGPGNLGRFSKNDVVTWKVTILIGDTPTTLGATPVVSAYEEGSTTEFTGGITSTADYDGKTGLLQIVADTSNAAFSAGKHYDFFISSGVAGIVSQVGAVVGHFALIPEPADLRMVNGGSTGTTAGKLELPKGLLVTGEVGASAVKLVGGAADASVQAGAGLLVVGGAASADQLSSPGLVAYGGAGTATKAAGAGVIVGAGVVGATGPVAPGAWIISNTPSTYGGHAEFDSDPARDIKGVVIQTTSDAIVAYSSRGGGAIIGSTTDTGVDIAGGKNGLSIEGGYGVGGGWSGVTIVGAPADTSTKGGPALLLQGGVASATHEGGEALLPLGGDGTATQAAGRAAWFQSGKDNGGGGPAEAVLVNGAAANDGDYVASGGGNVHALTMTPSGTGIPLNPELGGGALPELAQGVPPATPTPAQALMLMYMFLRNQLKVDSSANLKEVYNSAGTRIAKKAIADDGTTYTESRMTSGA